MALNQGDKMSNLEITMAILYTVGISIMVLFKRNELKSNSPVVIGSLILAWGLYTMNKIHTETLLKEPDKVEANLLTLMILNLLAVHLLCNFWHKRPEGFFRKKEEKV